MAKLTPMMEQYLSIKKLHKDCILFFRLGDFYEMFFEDAITASSILDITLTGKSCGLSERAPMCGVPYHSAESYIHKLIAAGKKVAICEQTENPSEAKGIVRREVIRIITPGTVLDENIISKNRNNFLMGISYNPTDDHQSRQILDISFIDVSTGDRSTRDVLFEDLPNLFQKVSPVELVFDQSAHRLFFETSFKYADYILRQIAEKNIVVNLFSEIDTAPLKLKYDTATIKKSMLMIYHYIDHTQKSVHLMSKSVPTDSDRMLLDQFTFKNLELTETIRGGKLKGSLLWVLDQTKTPMGGRMLKNWAEYPLVKRKDIEERLNMVQTFYDNVLFSQEISKILKNIYDIERICSKLLYDTSKHYDIIKLKHSLAEIPTLKTLLENKQLVELSSSIGDFESLYRMMDEALEEIDDYKKKNDYIIRSSYNEQLKSFRDTIDYSSDIILEMEQREKENTGIKSLKIGYNKVFGYYIEISKASLKNVSALPKDYIRKQTLASAERYINEELKIIEEKILTAKEQADSLEQHLYQKIKEEIKAQADSLLQLAKLIAAIDCYNALATVAVNNSYVRPFINEKGHLSITNGRHPVVEKVLSEENFVPNDSEIDKNQIHIITGPNMAGKSTYMRQVALIVLMAHMGSFVPCTHADICLIDQLFTRVGASDDLSQGQSTFMVEMSEVSSILKNATSKSLIILDEIGRGTSTYDGMSIAYSVIEYIQKKIQAKSLISTHYHEITALEEQYDNICNFSMAVDESEGQVNFLRKIIPGKADKSYGIHVAKLAELPEEIIEKSYKILKKLEKEHAVHLSDSFGKIDIYAEEKTQISFEEMAVTEIANILRSIDINDTTPMEALKILNELKNKVS